MTYEELLLLCGAIGVIAFLYSSVGHAGASGYIAVLALAGFAPAVIKPTALTLNILVATVTARRFYRGGHFSWSLFWPFAILAIPMAFLGGAWNLPADLFKVLVGLILIFCAIRFLVQPAEALLAEPPSRAVAIPTGAGLGLLAGLTGTGGGVFLTPLLLVMRWAPTKRAAAVSSCFILANSVAGLLGHIVGTKQWPTAALPLAVVAVLAGVAGSYCGSERFPATVIKRLLAVVLLIAGAKLLFSPA